MAFGAVVAVLRESPMKCVVRVALAARLYRKQVASTRVTVSIPRSGAKGKSFPPMTDGVLHRGTTAILWW